jgi:transcriptional regulator with XRE-family HTH domain
MSTDFIDLARLGERLVAVRRTYGESIDLPNLEATLFAVLLGVPAATYQSYEGGEAEPTVAFLVTLRKKTGVSLDWLLEPS